MSIWQDLVDDHGFPAGDASVKRFVAKLREEARARHIPSSRRIRHQSKLCHVGPKGMSVVIPSAEILCWS